MRIVELLCRRVSPWVRSRSLQRMTVPSCRAATNLLLSGGVSVAAAADYLGHSPAELLRTYAHLVPQDHDRARSIVQAALVCHERVTRTDGRSAAAL